MKQTDALASKFFAMVHLGYIPEDELSGLCSNAVTFIAKHGGSFKELIHIDKQMQACFRHLNLCVYFPVEGNQERYENEHYKYKGKYAGQRRALAKQLAVYFKRLADEVLD